MHFLDLLFQILGRIQGKTREMKKKEMGEMSSSASTDRNRRGLACCLRGFTIMDSFFNRVYQVVAQIPRGKVATYGQIATLIGEPRSARVVGWAMHNAPRELNLPCHRVVNKAGSMSPGYIFGPGRQRKLLEEEGVTFKTNGCIKMEKHLWKSFEDR